MHEVALHAMLEQHLNGKVLRALEENGKSVTLSEKSAKMKVKVAGFSGLATVIRLGSSQRKLDHLRYLEDGNRKKVCDYLLIVPIEGEEYAVFVELKKTLESKGDSEEQLLRSRPLLDYLLSVCEVDEGGGTPRPRIYYVLIFEGSKLQKPTLRPDLAGMIDEIEYKTIEIRRFLGTEFELMDVIGL